jgi:hypothetical protein
MNWSEEQEKQMDDMKAYIRINSKEIKAKREKIQLSGANLFTTKEIAE